MSSFNSNTNARTREGVLCLPGAIEENITPLHDSLYNGSFILRQVHILLTEIVDRRSERPSCATHISTLLSAPESERCNICLEALASGIANLDDWKFSHSEAVTSCNHRFGAVCLWTVRNKPPFPYLEHSFLLASSLFHSSRLSLFPQDT